MGLLADIFSYSDTQKRRLRGLLDDPAGTLGLGATRAVEDQAGLLGLMDQAGVTPGSNSVLLDNKKRAAQQLADKALESFGGLLGATVWHGSPHKFDKFDSSKIGTGEGAQAYGHGLYLAESPDVAKSYQTTLTMDRGFNFGGKSGLTREQLQDLVNAREGGKYLDGVTKPSGVADQVIDSIVYGKKGELPRGYKSGSERAALFEKLKQEIAHTDDGALYKVDLPDEHIAKMLDWDKPLSQQAPEVQAALSGIETNFPTIPDFNLRKWMDADPLASTWHNVINRDLGVAPDAITSLLQTRGVPGIKYLDGGSRPTGGGTSNYVVFPRNDGLLKILERNGQPLK